MFGNSGGFEFSVNFIDRASMFVESVFETSHSFSCAVSIVNGSGNKVFNFCS